MMYRTKFHRHIPESRRLQVLAAAAMAALALSACGGAQQITTAKGDTHWTDDPNNAENPPSGWAGGNETGCRLGFGDRTLPDAG